MALIHLIYTSNLVEDEPRVLAAILQTAQHLNKLRGITGMLLHANGSILQVLEGDDEDVSRTFQSIEFDPRHQEIYVISKQEIAQRQFSSWTMGLRHLTESELDKSPTANQVFNANKLEIADRVKPGAALAMLVLFAQGVEVTN